MEKKVLFALFLLVMVSTAPLIATVSAGSHQTGIIANKSPDNEERELGNQVISSNETMVESDHQDEIAYDFSTAEGISLNVQYSSQVNATQFELGLGIRFLNITEFVDKNGDGLLSPGEALQTIDLTKLNYSSPQVTNVSSTGGLTGYKVESHTVGQSYTFQVIAYIFPKLTVINGTTLNPTEMKITIVISNFPYTQSSSALALIISARSQAQVEQAMVHNETGSVGNEEEIKIKDTTNEVYFSWLASASVDGVARPVNSTVSKTAEESLVTLTYPHGTTIVHDPKLGVSPLPVAGFGSMLLFVALAAAIVAVALVAVIRRVHPRIQNSVNR